MRKIGFVIATLLLLTASAAAQVGGGVTFIPPVTPNHCVKWLTYNIIQDAGAACGTGAGSVTSISNSDGTLTLSPNPIIGVGTISLNLGNANTWTANQTFNGASNIFRSLSGNNEAVTIGVSANTDSSTLVLEGGQGANGAGPDLRFRTQGATTIADIAPAGRIANTTSADLWIQAASGDGWCVLANGSTAAGTTSLCMDNTGAATFSGALTSASLNVTGSTVPANGCYLSAANTFACARNTTRSFFLAAGGLFMSGSGSPQLNVNNSNCSSSVGLIPAQSASGVGFSGDAINACVVVGGAQVALFTSTGLNTTAIGATTRSTAAFTTLAANSTVTLTGLALDTATADSTLCKITATNLAAVGSGTLGICTGTASSARFKREIEPLASSLGGLKNLPLITYRYRAGYADGGAKRWDGVLAEDIARVWPECAVDDNGKTHNLDPKGKPHNIDMYCIVFRGLKAEQELAAANDNLARRVAMLEHRR